MKKTAAISLLISFFLSQLTYAQVDSIEYNLWEQIYDFEISKNRYCFKKLDGEIFEILTYKVRDFWKNMVPELYPMFKDDLSNLTFAIFDMKGQIIYARNSQTYDIRVVHKYNELDSILKVVK